MQHKLVCIPQYTIGDVVVNYYCEAYAPDFKLSGGVKARSGWHEEPKVIEYYQRKPYAQYILTKDDIVRVANKLNLVIEFIQ